MVVNKRKKNSRQRGSKTHGWGAMKKHRGAGNRGGRGMAGTGKRGDAMKPHIWKDTKYFGKHGFIKHGMKIDINGVNFIWIEDKLDGLLSRKLASKEGDTYVIDVGKLGFNKLLGKGRVLRKFKINVDYASANVIGKVKEAGGEVIVSQELKEDK